MSIAAALRNYDSDWSTEGLLTSTIRKPCKQFFPGTITQRGQEPSAPIGKPVTAGEYVGSKVSYDMTKREAVYTFYWKEALPHL